MLFIGAIYKILFHLRIGFIIIAKANNYTPFWQL